MSITVNLETSASEGSSSADEVELFKMPSLSRLDGGPKHVLGCLRCVHFYGGVCLLGAAVYGTVTTTLVVFHPFNLPLVKGFMAARYALLLLLFCLGLPLTLNAVTFFVCHKAQINPAYAAPIKKQKGRPPGRRNCLYFFCCLPRIRSLRTIAWVTLAVFFVLNIFDFVFQLRDRFILHALVFLAFLLIEIGYARREQSVQWRRHV